MLRRCVAGTGRCALGSRNRLRQHVCQELPRVPVLCCDAAGSAAAGAAIRPAAVAQQRGFASFRVDPLSEVSWKRKQSYEDSNNHTMWIAVGVTTVFAGVFALVPLYKIYCQSAGEGQASTLSHKEYAPPPVGEAASKRLITVDFTGTVHNALPWTFAPQQRRVVVGLGETALAFYRAKNTSDRAVIGTSVYHMYPAESGLYFNKIQCFCFDEQLINPHEEVDLPIFFFIDPMMAQDSRFDHIDRITLSYLFYESDSDVPEEYSQFRAAKRSEQSPLALGTAGGTLTLTPTPASAPSP